MIVRKVTDSDGECFAKCSSREEPNECLALRKVDYAKCGTYECPFYKAVGCEHWVRIEKNGEIQMYAPEEVGLI